MAEWPRLLGHYILDANGDPQLCEDFLAWAEWFEGTVGTRERVLAHDRDEGANGLEILVSTVFLGLDHSFGGGPPVLWETMVLGGLLDGLQMRYTSREEAFRGHQEICRRVSESVRGSP